MKYLKRTAVLIAAMLCIVCPALGERLILPNDLTVIGAQAFSGLSSVSEVVLPAGVEYIAPDAFESVDALFSVEYGTYAHDWCMQTGHDYATQNGTYEYTVRDGSASITGYLGMVSQIAVPSVLDDYPVTAVSLRSNKTIRQVVLPDSVKSIGKSAFSYCTNLVSIQLPDSLRSMGEEAFYRCSSLTEIVIPGSVSKVAKSAFYHCTSLASVTLSEGVTSVDDRAFYYCTALKEVNIPSTVREFGEYAFSLCTALEEIRLPAGMKTLGNSAFSSCSRLKRIEVPAGVSTILYLSFNSCERLTTVVLPASVTNISGYTFDNCSKDLTFYVYEGSFAHSWCIAQGESYKLIDRDYTYTIENNEAHITGYTGTKTEISVPSSILGYPVGSVSLRSCDTIRKVSLPEGVVSLPDHAFSYCSNLTGIQLPDGIVSFGQMAFSHCESLEGIWIPDSVTSLGSDAFSDCSSLARMSVPDGVSAITDGSFNRCSKLKSIVIGQSVSTIGSDTFMECPEELVYFVYEGSYAQQWCAQKGKNYELIQSSYRQGDSGEYVALIQTYLSELGYYTGEITGSFAAETANAVKAFQSSHDLARDGIVSTQVRKMLQTAADKGMY